MSRRDSLKGTIKEYKWWSEYYIKERYLKYSLGQSQRYIRSQQHYYLYIFLDITKDFILKYFELNSIEWWWRFSDYDSSKKILRVRLEFKPKPNEFQFLRFSKEIKEKTNLNIKFTGYKICNEVTGFIINTDELDKWGQDRCTFTRIMNYFKNILQKNLLKKKKEN